MKKIYPRIKRLFDFSAALFLCILLSPVFLSVCLLILFDMGLPLLFKQERAGKNGRIFTIYKFRTMNNKRDKNNVLLPDFRRLTPLGKILRRYSLDELPQLVNILKGEMSFIGPRPLLTEYIPIYSKEQFRRHDVTPGISGYAQIHGRNSSSWPERFKKDLYYVEHLSFLLDLKIVFGTVRQILFPAGINSSDKNTMPKFRGEQ